MIKDTLTYLEDYVFMTQKQITEEVFYVRTQ